MKKVLIITYYWLPAGGPGVQRWLKFVKYLRTFGIEPIVYVPENPTYPIIDNEIGSDLPADLQIVKQPIWEPYGLASFFSKKKTQKISSGIIPRKKVSLLDKLLLWIRGNLFIPDARKFWVKPSVKYLKKIITENNIETIITTSPPHSVHLIGYHLKKQLPHLKWITDFRDPWTTIGYYKDLRLSKWADKRQHYWEKEVLQHSDLVITTSFKTQKDFQQLTDTPVQVITNGYDEEITVAPPLSKKFLISHIGSLLSDRNPKILWEVLAELVREEPCFAKDFELCFAGKVSEDIEEDICAYGLQSYYTYKGYIAHQEAVSLQKQSQVLLLIEIDAEETQGIIAGKLFEYMVSGRPILAIGPKDWDVSPILTETQTGITISYSDKELLKTQLLDYYHQFKSGTLHSTPKNIEKYSRKALTEQLAKVL
ncbi:glycosyl transferase family 1 [Capnocytophaga sp. HP1101]